jgi:hypothetical protein
MTTEREELQTIMAELKAELQKILATLRGDKIE